MDSTRCFLSFLPARIQQRAGQTFTGTFSQPSVNTQVSHAPPPPPHPRQPSQPALAARALTSGSGSGSGSRAGRGARYAALLTRCPPCSVRVVRQREAEGTVPAAGLGGAAARRFVQRRPRCARLPSHQSRARVSARRSAAARLRLPLFAASDPAVAAPTADGDLLPGDISALSRSGYGRNDGDGRFWNDDDKQVTVTNAATRSKGAVVRNRTAAARRLPTKRTAYASLRFILPAPRVSRG